MTKTKRIFWIALLMACAGSAVAALPLQVGDKPVTSLAPLVEATSPAVVNIQVRQTVSTRSPFADDAMRRFFNLPNSRGADRQIRSAGSGVIVNAAKGYILTNHHVVKNADEILVTLLDGELLEATVIGSDAETDIAVLQVDAGGLTEMPIGDSTEVRVGDFVIAIGNPFGLGHTVTSGIVSALGRTGIGVGLEDFIQTDASINPGNSGGALVNMNGELVGINSAIISRSGGNVGIGFAVPTAIAQSVMRQILDFGEVHRGLLGVSVRPVVAAATAALNAPVDSGARIIEISPNSAAEKSGLRIEDIIIEVNDKKISNARELSNAIGFLTAGDEVTIRYVRDGDTLTTVAELGERVTTRLAGGDIHRGLVGAEFQSTTASSVRGIEVITVAEGSAAAQRGLREGDVVVMINRQPVQSIGDLIETASENQILFMTVQRGNRQLMLQIR
ncbi:MAG: Do family serine endopeptidase [Proteobacteria bacterium]|nr:Do family serine endopeptidase [Pseudomonadota bacterium]